MTKLRQHASRYPEHAQRDEPGDDDVRQNAKTVVPERRAQDELRENDRRRPRRQFPERGAARVFNNLRGFPPEARAGKKSEADGNAEKNLGQAGVAHGDGDGQIKQDREAAQRCLGNDREDRQPSQPPHPAPRLPDPEPGGKENGQQAHEGGDHSVPMLELHAADHPRHTKTAKRGRPIRDGKAGIVAGYQRPRNDQEKSREGYEDRVTVEPAVIEALIHLRLPFACDGHACLAAEPRPPWGVRGPIWCSRRLVSRCRNKRTIRREL